MNFHSHPTTMSSHQLEEYRWNNFPGDEGRKQKVGKREEGTKKKREEGRKKKERERRKKKK